MPRPQFALKTLLWLMALVAVFFAGIGFEQERQRRVDEAVKSEIRSRIADLPDTPAAIRSHRPPRPR